MNKQEKSKMHRFINDNEFITMYIGGDAEFETTVVDSKRLRRLISKMDDQPEPQKVKGPACAGELLDYYRKSADVDLLALLICFKDWYFRNDKTSDSEEAIDWLVKHPEKFMKAWIDGYEVEEEPLYTVTFNLDLNYHLALDEGDGDDEISTTLTTGHDVLGYRYFLTEKEIKSIDERYWAFAVPVEEVVEG